MKTNKILVFIIFISSCNNVDEKDKTIDSLINANKVLQSRLSETEYKLEVATEKLNQEPAVLHNHRYAFVKLECYKTVPHPVEVIAGQTLGGYIDTQYYSSTSPVNDFEDFNNDTKYHFMDLYEESFRSSHKYDNSTIVDRKCFDFDSYSAASIELEKWKGETHQ